MERNGIKWKGFAVIPFCGFDRCSVDPNGRIKLSPAALANFGGCGAGVVLRCLPEGAIGVYSEPVFLKMRQSGAADALPKAASSSLFRRNLRMLNAMSQPVTVSPQGRITLPPDFRTFAGLNDSPEAVVVGVEIGVEIWSMSRWNEEQKKIMSFASERDEMEMRADLNALNNGRIES